MKKLWRFVVALLVLNLVVLVHEGGHWVAFEAVDIRVDEAALGFGPVIASTDVGHTSVAYRLLPIGGYVIPRDHGPHSYESASLLDCAIGEAAGVTGGLLAAFLLLLLSRSVRDAWRESFGALLRFARGRMPSVPVRTGDGSGLVGPIGIMRGLFQPAGFRMRLEQFIGLNVALSCFNLLPLYPLDGGRMADHVIVVAFGERVSAAYISACNILFFALIAYVMVKDVVRLRRG